MYIWVVDKLSALYRTMHRGNYVGVYDIVWRTMTNLHLLVGLFAKLLLVSLSREETNALSLHVCHLKRQVVRGTQCIVKGLYSLYISVTVSG